MTEPETVLIEPTEIKVREGLDRFRQDMGDIKELLASFERFGQIVPIIINREMELVDGGRRLAACLLGQRKALAIFNDTADPLYMRRLELESNVRRKAFTPAEESLAIEEIHKLEQQIHGVAHAGKTGGHGLKETAAIIGKTKGTVHEALEFASIIRDFPELRAARTKSELRKAVKGIGKVAAAMDALSKFEHRSQIEGTPFKVENRDAEDFMADVPDCSINVLFTDPLYGINADKLTQHIGGRTGGKLSISGYKIEDDTDHALYYVALLAVESFRFCTDDAHGYIFCAPEHFYKVRDFFVNAGWQAYIRPIIWIKRSVGQNNAPHCWPSSCYEMILYVRKEASKLVVEGMPDWVECPPVLPAERVHQYEKPVKLLTNLLDRVCLPGQSLVDPFMGSGSGLEAGLRKKLFVSGCDTSKEAYAMTLGRLSRLCQPAGGDNAESSPDN